MMEPYLYGVRDDVHIFDLEQTVRAVGLRLAFALLWADTLVALHRGGMGQTRS